VDNGGLLQMWARSVSGFLDCAAAVIRRRDEFLAIPPMELREGDDEEDEEPDPYRQEAEARRPGEGQLPLFER